MKQVFLDAMGKCPGCNQIFELPDEVFIGNMPTPPHCFCGATLTAESQGFERTDDGWQKVEWLTKEGSWSTAQSQLAFELHGMVMRWWVIPGFRQLLLNDEREEHPLLPKRTLRLATLNGKLV